MKRIMISVASIAIAGGLGAACGYKAYPMRHKAALPSAYRQNAILAHAAQEGRVDTIVIGDSIVEQAELGDLCADGVTLNAGVSGARAQDLVQLMGELMASQRPKRTIIAVGINDTAKVRLTSDAEFERSYAALLKTAKAGSGHVEVALVSPTTDGGLHGAGYFDQDAKKRFDHTIARLAQAEGIETIDVASALGNSSPELPEELSADGPHLTPAGYGRWKSAIRGGCS